MTDDILQKLDKLPSDSPYQSWKDRVPKLLAQADWQEHPITRDLKQDVSERIIQIKGRLADDDNLTPQEQDRLRGEKKALQFYLDKIMENPLSELQTIRERLAGEIDA